MIAHVVLFQPRTELTASQRQQFVDALQLAARDISSVRRFTVGRRVKHGLPGYEQVMMTDYDFVAIVEFDDLDGLRSYLAHPAHSHIGRLFTDASSGALAYDYETVDAAQAHRLLTD